MKKSKRKQGVERDGEAALMNNKQKKQKTKALKPKASSLATPAALTKKKKLTREQRRRRQNWLRKQNAKAERQRLFDSLSYCSSCCVLLVTRSGPICHSMPPSLVSPHWRSLPAVHTFVLADVALTHTYFSQTQLQDEQLQLLQPTRRLGQVRFMPSFL